MRKRARIEYQACQILRQQDKVQTKRKRERMQGRGGQKIARFESKTERDEVRRGM